MSDVVVIGVGNPYRHDDGVGPAVTERLGEQDLPHVRVTRSDGDPLHLIQLWTGARTAVVVDAARSPNSTPGAVHRLTSLPAGDRSTSSHGLGVADAVGLGRVLGRLPDRLVVYAVEPADLSPGVGLSPAVRAAVESVADAVRSEVGAALGSVHDEQVEHPRGVVAGAVADQLVPARWQGHGHPSHLSSP